MLDKILINMKLKYKIENKTETIYAWMKTSKSLLFISIKDPTFCTFLVKPSENFNQNCVSLWYYIFEQ